MAIDEQENQNGGNDDDAAGGEPTKSRRRKRRWGDANTATITATTATTTMTTTTAPAAPPAADNSLDATRAKVLAMQETIKARLVAAKAAAAAAAGETAASSSSSSLSANRPTKRAKHFELDLTQTAPTYQKTTDVSTSRKKNENSNTATAAAASRPQPTKPSNPYLATTDDGDDEPPDEEYADRNLPLTAGRHRRKPKALQFIEPGTFTALAERKRAAAANAEAAGVLSGRKTGHTLQAPNSISAVYGPSSSASTVASHEQPRWDEVDEKAARLPIALEWWDLELLPKSLKTSLAAAQAQALTSQAQQQMQSLDHHDANDQKPVAAAATAVTDDDHDIHAELRAACWQQASISYSKTAALVQHIVPIVPMSEQKNTTLPTLHLTQKERKRARQLRRAARQRELHDLQAAGLVPAPEPRLTLQNFMKVLGDSTVLDPSQLEAKVRAQMDQRQRAHQARNEAAKLTKQQRASKMTKKFAPHQDRTEQHVAVFYVANVSHPLHRAKLDKNAAQFQLTGCVLECSGPAVSMVVVEGGPQSVHKFIRLMTVRMQWTGNDDGNDDDDVAMNNGNNDDDAMVTTHKFNADNRCELVWQGLAPKKTFTSFSFHAADTAAQCRKIMAAKGLAHYWDQTVQKAMPGGGLSFFRQAQDNEEDDHFPCVMHDDDNDVVMQDSS